MTVGSIVSLAGNETDQNKINFAIQQALERVGGKQVNASVATTAAYTAKTSDFMIDVSGATTVTLPSASSAPGQIYCFKKTDVAGTMVTIDPGSNTIDGSTAATLTSSYQALLIQSNAVQWDILLRASSASSSAYLLTANNLSELTTSATTARSNLGLGTFATQNSSTPPAIGNGTPAVGAFTTLDASNYILSSSPSGGIGYKTGAGGTATQASSAGKTGGVTVNTVCGTVTMNSTPLGANTTVSFNMQNSSIANTDGVFVWHQSIGTAGAYLVGANSGSGNAAINVRNVTAGSLSEAIVLGFAVIKSVTS